MKHFDEIIIFSLILPDIAIRKINNEHKADFFFKYWFIISKRILDHIIMD